MGFVDAFRTKLSVNEEDCRDEDNGLESRGLRTKRRPRTKLPSNEVEAYDLTVTNNAATRI